MDLLKRIVKKKKLQSVGRCLGLIIPKKWLDVFDWTKEDTLRMTMDGEGRIIIQKDEKASNPIPEAN